MSKLLIEFDKKNEFVSESDRFKDFIECYIITLMYSFPKSKRILRGEVKFLVNLIENQLEHGVIDSQQKWYDFREKLVNNGIMKSINICNTYKSELNRKGYIEMKKKSDAKVPKYIIESIENREFFVKATYYGKKKEEVS